MCTDSNPSRALRMSCFEACFAFASMYQKRFPLRQCFCYISKKGQLMRGNQIRAKLFLLNSTSFLFEDPIRSPFAHSTDWTSPCPPALGGPMQSRGSNVYTPSGRRGSPKHRQKYLALPGGQQMTLLKEKAIYSHFYPNHFITSS